MEKEETKLPGALPVAPETKGEGEGATPKSPIYKSEYNERFRNYVSQYICDVCNAVLAEFTEAGPAMLLHFVSDCEHYKWVTFSRYCFERLPCDECDFDCMVELCNDAYDKRVEVIFSSTSVYILNPVNPVKEAEKE